MVIHIEKVINQNHRELSPKNKVFDETGINLELELQIIGEKL